MNSVTSEKTTEYYELSPEGTSSSTQHTRFRLAVAEKTQALYIFYSNHVKTCSCQSYCLQSQNTSSRKKKNFFFAGWAYKMEEMKDEYLSIFFPG